MPDDRQAVPLTLTVRELLYLLDSISNADVDQGDLEQPMRVQALARPLVLKLASLFLEVVPTPVGSPDMLREGAVAVTEREAWLLRGKVTMGAFGLDKVPIGPALLRKLYVALLEFGEVDVGPLAETDEDSETAIAKLALLAEEERARFPDEGDCYAKP